MPDSKAKTNAGKQRFVAKTMGEFKAGDLKSSSGQRVTNPKQAVAIALSQTGQSKPPAARKPTSARLSNKLSARLSARDQR